jgi:hypothetical protein
LCGKQLCLLTEEQPPIENQAGQKDEAKSRAAGEQPQPEVHQEHACIQWIAQAPVATTTTSIFL